jgi:hypothetical protein
MRSVAQSGGCSEESLPGSQRQPKILQVGLDQLVDIVETYLLTLESIGELCEPNALKPLAHHHADAGPSFLAAFTWFTRRVSVQRQ